jgi:hypothetical protein
MDRQLSRQTRRRPELRESVVDLAGRDPPAPLGQPHRRMRRTLVTRQYLGQVLLQHLGRPRHHRGHRPPPGRATAHRLAEPDVTDPQPPQLGSGRIGGEIGNVQHHRLPAAQPPPIDHLEQRGVPERRQPALTPRARRPLHPVVSGIEERLQLDPGQRTPFRPALVVGDVHRGVPLADHLHRAGTEPLLTLGHPAIPRVADAVQEHRHRTLIGADRRVPSHPGRQPLS